MTISETAVDNAPDYAIEVARLARWSPNYREPTPYSLFLDLIGYTTDHYGEAACDLDLAIDRLGYLELGMLAKALTQYADRPADVMTFIERVASEDA